ncbi:MAG: TfoX/Sxy family protein [Phycisphaerales bacterium]|nr:TfoX/Sxy family protein [Phycisphaerales bacterium]
MATSQETIDELLGLVAPLGNVTAKKMFGEFCVYVDGQAVALVCDDCLFVKPTEPGRALSPGRDESPPYPGAKPHLEYPIDSWGDGRHLCELLRATHDALPAKTARKKVSKSAAKKPSPRGSSGGHKRRPKS